ncbi:Deoxyguanosinetriphosphate triphosphohydrolase-like protein [Trichinella spiralis]|uniref:Deoxyguanosinetriphosphate triphosphohydrolase-like protein n=1 Tax=Trichinella spiralis TaxID=6334 RepID=A0ABR3KRR5_TRISP
MLYRLLICILIFRISLANNHEELLMTRIRSKPVVLQYQSEVNFRKPNPSQATAPSPLVPVESIFRQAPIDSFDSHPFSGQMAKSEDSSASILQLPQSSSSRRDPKIATAPGLSSVLRESQNLFHTDGMNAFKLTGQELAAKGMPILSDFQNAFPKDLQSLKQFGSGVSQAFANQPAPGKSSIDVVGLTRDVLNPMLKNIPLLKEDQNSPSAAVSSNPLSQKGLLEILKGLGKKITSVTGLDQAALPTGVAPRGPPVAGLPSLPSIFPGITSPNQKVDVMGLISAIGKKIMQKTNVTSLIKPDALQNMADNITDALVPEMPNLNLAQFMGRWFEGINSPRATEDRCIVHHFGGLTENGKTATFTALKIYREGSDFGQVRYSIGYAFRGGRQPGMLQMHTSESSDPLPFWVYKVGPVSEDSLGNRGYDYAIVSNWIRYPVAVLVRDPDVFKEKYEDEVLKWLEEKNFINGLVRAFNLVQPVNYDNCQYSESAFKIFG